MLTTHTFVLLKTVFLLAENTTQSFFQRHNTQAGVRILSLTKLPSTKKWWGGRWDPICGVEVTLKSLSIVTLLRLLSHQILIHLSYEYYLSEWDLKISFCFMHYFNLLTSTHALLFSLLFLIYNGEFLVFLCFVLICFPPLCSPPPPGMEEQTNIQPFAFYPGHFKSALCFQGSVFSRLLLLSELLGFVIVCYSLCNMTSLSPTAHFHVPVEIGLL